MSRIVPLPLRSSVPDVAWPVPETKSAHLLALLYQLEQAQWWSAEELRAAQFRQLARLLAHAAATVHRWRSSRWCSAEMRVVPTPPFTAEDERRIAPASSTAPATPSASPSPTSTRFRPGGKFEDFRSEIAAMRDAEGITDHVEDRH